MASEDRFPNFLGGVSALGRERLRELAGRANATFAPPDDARRLSTSLLAMLDRPDELEHYDLTDAEVETIGLALGLGERADWRPRVSVEEFERLPFYAKPSYQLDVWNTLGSSIPLPAADARPAQRTDAPVGKPSSRRPTKATPTKATPAKAKAKAKTKAKATPAKSKTKATPTKARPTTAKPAKAKAKPSKATPKRR